MKISALEEYGLRCMIILAREGRGTPLSLSDISAREGLSVPYAGKLLMILRQAGLVKAVRGRQGGYTLSRRAEDIFLKEIFDALGEPLFGSAHCDRHAGGRENCVHTEDCTVHHIWSNFDNYISGVLQRVTLADLCQNQGQMLEIIRGAETPLKPLPEN